MKKQNFYLVVKKFSIGLALLLIFSLLITSSPVRAEADPLENDFTLIWGGIEDEEVYAMEFFSDDIVYVAGDIGTWDPYGGGGNWYTSVGFFLTRLNVSKIRSGNPFPEWSFNWERTDAIGIFGDMIIDPSENIYVAGTVHNDIFLMRFNNAGILDWNITWGIGGVDSTYGFNSQHPDGKCLIMDSANNIYIAGRSGEDVVLIKYNNLGEYQWNRTWNILPDIYGWGPSDDYCEDISIDSNDNIYVSVFAQHDNLGDHSAVLKCNSDGNLQWNTTFININFPFLIIPPTKISIDSDGLSYYSATYLTKFDLNTGNHLWNKSILTAFPIKMDYDSMGNLVILTGIPLEEDPYPGSGTCDLLTFTSEGIVQINFTHPGQISPFDFSVDSMDNIFTLSYNGYNDNSVFITKINPNGENQYYFSWGSPEDESHDDFPSKIFVDSSGNIYVSGRTSGFGGDGNFNIFFAAFSQRTPSEEPSIPFDLTIMILSTLFIIGVLLARRKRKLT